MLSSKRLPKKALELIEGTPAIVHLLDRLKSSNLKIVLCTSNEKQDDQLQLIANQLHIDCYRGSKENVIKRLYGAGLYFGADHIIRITADDLLVDIQLMREMLKQHFELGNDYTFMTNLPRGMDCEAIRLSALEKILEMFPRLESTEYVSYYLKRPDMFKYSAYVPPLHYQKCYRLTMDYPEDLKLLRVLFSNLPKNFMNWELIEYLDRHPYLADLNRLPKISCYITNHDYGDYLEQAINTVFYQTIADWELILIDDHSTEIRSLDVILAQSENPKVRIVRNESNLGLNRTANKALDRAKGEYILRLDADDLLLPMAFEKMSRLLDENADLGIVYPNYCEWDNEMSIRSGREVHHPAGAMIRKSCWNEIKYNENYRCQDGFDFHLKFKDRFGIGYLDDPCFVYRKHKGSLSSDKELIESTRSAMSHAS